MGRMTSSSVIITLLLGICNTNVRAEEEPLGPIISDVAEYWSNDAAEYWSPMVTDSEVGEPIDISTGVLEEVTPVQMLAPQRRPSLRVAQNRRRRRAAAAGSGLASVPFMIGDTGAGTCLSFSGLLDVELSHPTLTCNRLNVSENNSAMTSNRLYFSYRHFQNATSTRVYQFEQDLNVDRFTLGGERTFCDDLFSFEVRVPLEGRLNSDTITRLRALDTVPVFEPLDGGDFFESRGLRRAELGNIAMILKAMLYERKGCAVSAGVAFTLPTARDVNYQADINNSFTFADPALTANQDILLHLTASNETVYIAPFLAWLFAPNDRWYHQGFLQVEVAADDSSIGVVGAGSSEFFVNNVSAGTDTWAISFPGQAPLSAQTLLRLNLGWGYVLKEDPRARWIQKLTALFETHYTTTLNDANLWTIPVIADPGLGPNFGSQDLTFGNLDNRVDIVNVVTGLTMGIGDYVVTHGFTTPITTGSNRGFDFEYNLQIQRPF